MSTIVVDRLEYQAMRIELMALQARRQREELIVEILELSALLRYPLYRDMRTWSVKRLEAERDLLRRTLAARKAYAQRFLEQSA